MCYELREIGTKCIRGFQERCALLINENHYIFLCIKEMNFVEVVIINSEIFRNLFLCVFSYFIARHFVVLTALELVESIIAAKKMFQVFGLS